MCGNTVANKNHVGKHCNNSQCFKEKSTKQNSQSAQYKKNKIESTKTISKKKKNS
jgi:hypothetical protein